MFGYYRHLWAMQFQFCERPIAVSIKHAGLNSNRPQECAGHKLGMWLPYYCLTLLLYYRVTILLYYPALPKNHIAALYPISVLPSYRIVELLYYRIAVLLQCRITVLSYYRIIKILTIIKLTSEIYWQSSWPNRLVENSVWERERQVFMWFKLLTFYWRPWYI